MKPGFLCESNDIIRSSVPLNYEALHYCAKNTFKGNVHSWPPLLFVVKVKNLVFLGYMQKF